MATRSSLVHFIKYQLYTQCGLNTSSTQYEILANSPVKLKYLSQLFLQKYLARRFLVQKILKTLRMPQECRCSARQVPNIRGGDGERDRGCFFVALELAAFKRGYETMFEIQTDDLTLELPLKEPLNPCV